MKIILPVAIERKLAAALHKAGQQEIGGILMGEYLEVGLYRVQELTVQGQAGTFASFVRLAKEIVVPLQHFFRKTRYDYKRFNYLGEWHSHPSFLARPSGRDSETMWEMLQDADIGANFAVLLVVRLSSACQVEGTVTVYLPECISFEAELLREEPSELSNQESMEHGVPGRDGTRDW
jgi:proteasome lid subunit RPN8/RPN11